jgi:hypothetical protein
VVIEGVHCAKQACQPGHAVAVPAACLQGWYTQGRLGMVQGVWNHPPASPLADVKLGGQDHLDACSSSADCPMTPTLQPNKYSRKTSS